MVAETNNFPPPDTSVCEQMTWPLTYDDGINLRAKDCSEEAHFVCRVDGNICLLLFSFDDFYQDFFRVWNSSNSRRS